MNNISRTMRELPVITFPPGLHGKIMRQLFFLKFRIPFFIISALLVCNIAISMYHIWSRMINTEMFSIVATLWEGFEWTFDFFVEFMRTITEYFPIGSFVIVMTNFLLLGYIVFLYFSLKKLSIANSQHSL